jgi:hypothetical protein
MTTEQAWHQLLTARGHLFEVAEFGKYTCEHCQLTVSWLFEPERISDCSLNPEVLR